MNAMNEVQITLSDSKCNMHSLSVNGQFIVVAHLVSRDLQDRLVHEFSVNLANDWNMSNRMVFMARSLPALVKKLAKHEYKLVKPAF
jgi:hypothetical protein